jgi:hypothetical protein
MIIVHFMYGLRAKLREAEDRDAKRDYSNLEVSNVEFNFGCMETFFMCKSFKCITRSKEQVQLSVVHPCGRLAYVQTLD